MITTYDIMRQTQQDNKPVALGRTEKRKLLKRIDDVLFNVQRAPVAEHHIKLLIGMIEAHGINTPEAMDYRRQLQEIQGTYETLKEQSPAAVVEQLRDYLKGAV